MKDRVKVLLVSPYSDNVVGGIIIWTKNIVNYHREHHDDIDLCLLNNTNAVQVMAAANPLKRLFYGLRNYIPIYRRFKAKIASEHFDAAHICTSASLGLIRDLLIVKAARKNKVKTAVHMHFGRIPQILKTKGWEKFLLIKLMKRVDYAVVMDKESFRALKNEGLDNVCFLPNPLSPEVESIIERQGLLEREPGKIVFAGHICETKGVCELVAACRDIKGLQLKLLGKLAVEGIYERIMEIGGPNAKNWLYVPGNRPYEDVIREMLTCSLFVLPSYSEGFPNVILESMACGCPIVATPVGAIPEMLDIEGVTPCGACVPVKDVNALRHAILCLLSDNAGAMRLGQLARQRVNDLYTISKVWEQLVGIWKSLAH